MTKVLSLFLMCFFFVACNKDNGGSSTGCTSSVQAEENATGDCVVTEPSSGETTGSTAGGTTGGTSGGTTGSSTGGTSGGTTGGTTGSSTGGTSGGTSGGTTGSSSGGSSSLPNEAFTFDANISFYNVSAAQEAKFMRAIDVIKQVVATEEFRSRILNFTYKGSKTFVDNGGFTNAQIYQKILNGAETLQSKIDNEMDMEVEIYTASNSTVGYTYASSKRVWVNTKFFNTYTAAGVARNLFHEWLHKLGFTHSSSYNTARDSSVPYAIGNIVGELGNKFL